MNSDSQDSSLVGEENKGITSKNNIFARFREAFLISEAKNQLEPKPLENGLYIVQDNENDSQIITPLKIDRPCQIKTTQETKIIFSSVSNQNTATQKVKPRELCLQNTASKKLTCDICLVHFYDEISFKRHFIRHISNKPHKCTYCCKSFFKQANLDKHLSFHASKELKRLREELNRRLKKIKKKLHTCPVCFKVFSKRENVAEHVSLHSYQTEIYPCDVCNVPCLSEEDCNLHLQRHLFRDFVCNICFSEFENREGLISHEKEHVVSFKTNKPTNSHEKVGWLYVCPFCDESLNSFENFQNHMNTHDAVKTYLCNVCYSEFFFCFSYETHLFDCCKPAYYCNICSKSFRDKERLYTHEYTHLAPRLDERNSKIFGCDLCNKQFSYRSDIFEHYINDHFDENKRKYKCRHCTEEFFFGYQVITHARKKHRKAQKCPQCDYTSNRIKDHIREVHQKIHHKCNICKKVLSTKPNLNKHMLVVHAKVKTLSCEICNKSFSRKHNLSRHSLTHSDKKHFQCKDCKKRFYSYDGLHDHRKVYHLPSSDGIEFACPVCKLKFPTSTACRVHKRKNHHKLFLTPKPNIMCEICGAGFTLLKSFTKHYKTHPENDSTVIDESIQKLVDDRYSHKCDFCEHSSTNLSNLYKHLSTHHSDACKYLCKFCKKGYNRKSYMHAHMKECQQNPDVKNYKPSAESCVLKRRLRNREVSFESEMFD